MSGANNGEGSAGILPTTKTEREESSPLITLANEFTQYCTRVLEQFQAGQLPYVESVLRIAVQVSQARIEGQEAGDITKNFFR